MDEDTRLFDIEVRLLLEGVFQVYQHDFRNYATASLRRRMQQAMEHFGCTSISELQHRVLHDRRVFAQMLQFFTVQVSELFRDPGYFLALRQEVVPVLKTYPSLKVWVAGCSTGEELWSLAVLFDEEDLLERTVFYATDINPVALRTAEAGIYPLDRIARFSANYRQAGGRRSLSDYLVTGYDAAAFDRRLRKQVVFADHSLATDSVFSEVQMVSCRNVLIYFNRALQDRALGLFHDALVRRGFLGLGSHETVRFTAHAEAFEDLVPEHRIYRRR
ncbi:CheR family methyltransferase [Caldimonas thermodepolymerans]|uniref:Chemotaxis protein methyltransferase CheR n=1 Tax=Caldimonas thermodepolymerans TaxID=215580 RepID=A0AA46DFT1_9BURK|nr:CheR family methyltransferase [Caldimonas thermodepolymerans]TCP08804.1 chemotaxis protein methyltransferase CheR [Caldimonas thermodepolymerans]UZG47125.1 protein-glutamate O-methyltransferase CheR [Caldimonas thermodepolymerans]